ncbi:MAG: uroporphyrinogen-III synthase [Deltaproteobacteria bacterium]|nr:MAG: uroporphyrinogen-III synthase [Deltaproteobacteria bacterium]
MTSAAATAPRVLVTRSRETAGRLSTLLAQRGLHPLEVPTLEVVPLPVPALPGILSGRRYDLLLLTSANGARCLGDAIRAQGRSPQELPVDGVAAVGPVTASAAQEEGWTVRVVARNPVAEGLVTALLDHGVSGRRLLFARARHVREGMVATLRAIGATVRELPVYATGPPEASRARLRSLVDAPPALITAASSRTITHLLDLLPPDARERWRTIPVASIGPITSRTARDLGFRHVVEAPTASMEALAETCAEMAARSA